jgi:hypothetical protein
MLIQNPPAGQDPLATIVEADDLAAKFQRYANALTTEAAVDLLAVLVKAGVTRESLEAATDLAGWGGPLLGFADVEIFRSGDWQPMPGAMRALIWHVVEGDDLVDLVAFNPKRPTALYSRAGRAWTLGADNLAAARWAATFPGDGPSPEPVLVLDNVLVWLAVGGRGICVVDWRRAGTRLADVHALYAPSPQIAAKLRRAFSMRIPDIFIDGEAA